MTLQYVEIELNTLLNIQEEELLTNGPDSHRSLILKKEITRCEKEVDVFRDAYAKKIILKSRAQWAEEGEKSTKYFLNLVKYRSAATYIHKIQTANGEVNGQPEIREEIRSFYKDLYSDKEVKESQLATDEFTNDLPKISLEDRATLERNLTLSDLA